MKTWEITDLRCGVLASYPLYTSASVTTTTRKQNEKTHVWAKLEVGDTTSDVLVVRIIKMAIKNLLGKR